MKTADVITENDIGNWLVDALSQELSVAGYSIKTVSELPNDVSKGLDLTILKVYVDQDPGFTSVGAISDVQFEVEIWKNGIKAKALKIAAKGDERIHDRVSQNKRGFFSQGHASCHAGGCACYNQNLGTLRMM